MNVEVYQVEELKQEGQILAADSQAAELIEKLGLTGQKELVNTETKTRCPFRMITAVEAAVYHCICDQQTKLQEYRSGIIPLRVLEVIQTAKESGFFEEFEVWHPRDMSVKDPVLIGKRADPSSTWRKQEFILARWGEGLLPFDELMELAVSTRTKMLNGQIKKLKAECEQALVDLEALVRAKLAGGDVPTIYSSSLGIL